MTILKRFKQVSIKGLTINPEDWCPNWSEGDEWILCREAVHRMFHVKETDTLEVVLSCRKRCKDSVPITLSKVQFEIWHWTTGHKNKAHGGMYTGLSTLLHKHFGNKKQVIHGWLTIY